MKDNLSLFFSIPAGADRCTIRNVLRINRKIRDLLIVGIFISILLIIGIIVSNFYSPFDFFPHLLTGYTIFYVGYFFYLLSIIFLKRHCDAICMCSSQLELNSVLHNLNLRMCKYIRFFNKINKTSLIIVAVCIGLQILFSR